MISQSLSIRLKALRKSHGKTQADISKILGVLRTTYGEYERGKILPPMDRINKLADYYSVSVDYLMGNTNEPLEKLNSKNDVSEKFQEIIDSLQNHNEKITFYGQIIDETSRKFLIKSLENSIELARTISKKKD